jgi:DNA-binding transcriptional MerR regulator
MTTRYSLDELADAFGLTVRTARHYVEHVLPPHHKTGRGRRARYGEDTRLCFAFIRKARADKLSLAQIGRLLAELSPAQIERVVRGQEGLTIVPAERPEPGEFYSSPCMAGDFSEPPVPARPAGDIPRWQVLYSDDELQITHRGEASPEQRAQVRMAAAWIKRLFERP